MIRRLHQRWRSYNRRRRVVVVIGLLLAALLTPALVIAALAKLDPSWWPSPSADAQATANQAEALENAALAQASLVRNADPDATNGAWFSEPWSVAISESDANAWLESRLPRWLENRYAGAEWAKPLSEVRVRFREGAVDVGARLGTAASSRIAGATLHPRMDADSTLWAPASSVFAGRAGLPAPIVMRGLRGRVEAVLPQSVKNLPELENLFQTMLGE
ncbi:MAG: hypothetical protein PSX37_00135, partial [bacterium]|nr:hypothetical protein [bacterium]